MTSREVYFFFQVFRHSYIGRLIEFGGIVAGFVLASWLLSRVL